MPLPAPVTTTALASRQLAPDALDTWLADFFPVVVDEFHQQLIRRLEQHRLALRMVDDGVPERGDEGVATRPGEAGFSDLARSLALQHAIDAVSGRALGRGG